MYATVINPIAFRLLNQIKQDICEKTNGNTDLVKL